ncbi:MAG: hypothetical protein ABGZ17_00210 [Planctomycetaceae bacterium]
MREQMRVVMAVVAGLTLSADVVVAQQVVPVIDCCEVGRRQRYGQAGTTVTETPRVRQQLVYRDVQRQAYGQQAYLESVPVTRLRKVAVDRGSYQSVWVPKMVLQDVPETHYESRVRYRTVSVPVTQRVAEMRPVTGPCPPAMGSTLTVQTLPATALTSGVVLLAPEPWSAAQTAQTGVMPALTIPSAAPRFTTAGVPTPTAARGDWQAIPARSGSAANSSLPRLGGYRTAPQHNAPVRSTRRTQRSPQVRSAANVLRVQRSLR